MSEEQSTEAAIVKASVIEVDVAQSNATPTTEDDARVFSNYGAILPPYDPRQLAAMFERSCSLRPNVDVYKVNIEGFGHRLEPTIDLKAQDADDKIRDALILEKLADEDPTPDVPDIEVKARRLSLDAEMRIEKLRAEQFFKTCCSDVSFVELRERTRMDLEVTGNAYWEILRDGEGRIAEIVHLPAVSMRLLRADVQRTEVDVLRKVSALSYRRFRTRRRLRRYVQVLYGQFIAYFKELDDPRWMSARSGTAYRDRATFEAEEPGAPLATEVLHFKIPALTTAYGVPRWVGATLAVLGSRAAEEVNVTYFDNKAVPPLAVLVSGGSLAAGAADRITNYIRDNIRGKDNFHKILVLEAEPAAGALAGQNGSRVRIEIKNLMDAQQQDALFQQYDANNVEKVGNQFRLPKLLRGDMRDFNRATAEAALEYAEQQVFQPERNKIDHIINQRILPLLKVRFFEFVSNAVSMKDPAKLSQMVREDVKAGILTPGEGRELLGDAYNRTFPEINEDWTKKPLQITIAGMTKQPGMTDAAAGGDLEATARNIVTLRAALAEWEGRAVSASLAQARLDESAHVHYVPSAEWGSWFDDRAAAAAE